jgi:hypothetical protein
MLYALDDHVWGMKITALEKFADFTTLERVIVIMMLLSLVKL